MQRTWRNRNTWRQLLATFAPEIASLPASMHAVNLLLLRRKHDEALAACEEMLANGTMDQRDLLILSDCYGRSGKSKLSLRYRRIAYQAEMTSLGLQSQECDQAVRFCLAADGDGRDMPVPPVGYVRALFDQYAETFETKLVGELGYRGPAAVHDVLSSHLSSGFGDLRILDIGCGTGLAGPLFRPHASRLDGVDLSPAMIERARAKGVYDELQVGDLVDSLDGRKSQYDLILAIDVLIYVGDLYPMFQACRQVLRPGGMLAASCETGSAGPYHLADCRRYKHRPKYVRDVAEAQGFEIAHVEHTALRHERGKPVDFFIVLLRMP